MTAAASGDHSLGDDFLDRIDQMRENLRRFPIETLPDPTLGWSRDPKADLILNLDDSTFSDIKIGDPCAALSFLGRCDKFTPTVFNCVDTHGHRLDDPKVIYTLGYHSDGLGFSADKSFRIESFLVYLQPNPDEIGSKSYTGKVFWNGKAVDRVLLRNMDSFINTFGFPDEDNRSEERRVGKECRL